MEKGEMIQKLIEMLLCDMPQYRDSVLQFDDNPESQRRLLRSLMNVRPALPLKEEYVELQDQLISIEREEKGVVDVNSLPETAVPGIILWKGDITRLNADAIVNAANSALLGCFWPCHGCIDNAIHSAAGLQLRDECSQIINQQGHEEPTGQAKVTRAYNLPCRYVIHTVGPIITGCLQKRDVELLASCYRSCLEAAEAYNMKTVAFCCISTGEFHFPAEKAAETAVDTVREFLAKSRKDMKVIFNVFKESDETIYRRILGSN